MVAATSLADRDRITIAILALGGQGGGVLADWILALAEANGYVAQGTSVPGVAQRTGSTVYYIEMVRRPAAGANREAPILAMMPVPGDVDIVLASELMEAGRAILRGFVSADRTTLIGSTHRIYAISEKSALGDGIAASERILDAAGRRAARFIGFDMDAAASDAGSMISSVLFGALAGSGALPFADGAFEEAIRQSGKAIASNLEGFELGRARAIVEHAVREESLAPPVPTTAQGQALHARILDALPEAAQPLAIEGARRLMDYQDAAYAHLYLDRLGVLADVAREERRGELLAAAARHLALWMSYEDTIRVADLKIRATRSARVVAEVRVGEGQLLSVTEYMHPRLQELCEMLPAALGRFVLGSGGLRRWLERRFAKGRHVVTTSLRWYLVLRLVAAMRPMRRSSLRFREEQARIEAWLGLTRDIAPQDPALAIEILVSQGLIKGYSDTFERGLANFETVVAAARRIAGRPQAAGEVRALRDAALADDHGACLRETLAALAA